MSKLAEFTRTPKLRYATKLPARWYAAASHGETHVVTSKVRLAGTGYSPTTCRSEEFKRIAHSPYPSRTSRRALVVNGLACLLTDHSLISNDTSITVLASVGTCQKYNSESRRTREIAPPPPHVFDYRRRSCCFTGYIPPGDRPIAARFPIAHASLRINFSFLLRLVRFFIRWRSWKFSSIRSFCSALCELVEIHLG